MSIVDLAGLDPDVCTAKIFPRLCEGRFCKLILLRLRRGGRRHVDVRVRLGLGLRRRRWVHNRGVSFFLFRLLPSSSRRSDGGFLLFTRREQRGAGQDADVFFHSDNNRYEVTEKAMSRVTLRWQAR